MTLTYNGLSLGDLGELEITQNREYEGGDAPQRAKVTLNVTVHIFERDYASNHELSRSIRRKLKTQHALLVWEDEDTGTEWVNQTAIVLSDNLPETWGEYYQKLEIVFQFDEHDVEPQNQFLTFYAADTADATKPFIDLGHGDFVAEEIAAERYHELRSQRRRLAGRVVAGGMFLGNPLLPLDERRVQLLALKTQMMNLLNIQQGTLVFGGAFARVVRPENFAADIDQAARFITFSLTASYTVFPDEEDYFLVEFTVEQRDGNTGEQFLSLTGEVGAATEALAREHKNAVITVLLVQYGYLKAQQLNTGDTAARVQADADGETFLRLPFALEYRRFRPDNLQLTFTPAAGGGAVALGNVTAYEHGYQAVRFSPLRSQRQHAAGHLNASGTLIYANPQAALDARRKALLVTVNDLVGAVNGADGTLVYGTHFNGKVRVESFTARINQAITGIDWSISCVYTLFPNEAGMATVEFSATRRENVEDGDAAMTFSGRIVAQSEVAAIAQLDLVRATVLANPSDPYTLQQRLRAEAVAQSVYANGDKTAGLAAVESADGTTFIELNFTEEYRKRMSGVTSTTMRITESDDTKAGFGSLTYAGTVTASGATMDAAYAAALAQAQAMGAGKADFLPRSQISWDQRQTRAEAVGTANVQEFVRLEFAYEYQLKGGARAYIELTLEVLVDTFGNDSEQATGYVSAVDAATARAHFEARVRPLFAGRMVLGERLSEGRQALQTGGGFTEHFARLDFALSIFKNKPSGRIAIRYAIDTARDYRTLEQTITLEGSIFAPNVSAARSAYDALAPALNLGELVNDRFREDRQQATSESGVSLEDDVFVQYDFSATYLKSFEQAGLLDCEVTETVQYSGTRWVVQPLPFLAPPADPNAPVTGDGGRSIIQACGVVEGRRTVRGSVTAADYATAAAWADDQRSLLTGDIAGNHFRQPPVLEPAYQFAPRVDGVARGTGENVRVVRLAFTFEEILPHYPYGTVPGPSPAPLLVPAALFQRLGYVRNETTGLWHKVRARNNADGVVEQFLEDAGVP